MNNQPYGQQSYEEKMFLFLFKKSGILLINMDAGKVTEYTAWKKLLDSFCDVILILLHFPNSVEHFFR
jgi:hypothetical protein